MRVLPLACLLLLTPAPPLHSPLPTRTIPDTRAINWVLFDSVGLERVTAQAGLNKAVNRETVFCLAGGFLQALQPDSVLLVKPYEADSVDATQDRVSFWCPVPPDSNFVGTVHTHIGLSSTDLCLPSIRWRHHGETQGDDYDLLLNIEDNIVDYVVCDNGWVVWELKDGRLHAWRWKAF